MENRKVWFNASQPQLSKLRNGRKVRIKPAMEGKGFCMIVKPAQYNHIARAFGKGKGVELSLTPEELLANAQGGAEMSGQGIFGKKFDKWLKKTGIKKAVYAVGDVLKKPVMGAVDQLAEYAPGLAAGALSAAALAIGQPQLVPFAVAAGTKLGNIVGKKAAGEVKGYIDNPDQYRQKKFGEKKEGHTSNAGGTTGATAVYNPSGVNEMADLMGSNVGYMQRAGTGAMDYLQLQALADQARQRQMSAPTGIDQPNRGHITSNMQGNRGSMRWVGGTGEGLYAGKQDGRGFRAGSGFRASGGQLGQKGAAVLPPAMQSQPYSANFQFQHTLPPAYQKFSGSGQGKRMRGGYIGMPGYWDDIQNLVS